MLDKKPILLSFDFMYSTCDVPPAVHGAFAAFLTSPFAERLAKATDKENKTIVI